MIERPVKPISTAQAELNEIHTNLYETLDAVVEYINDLPDVLTELDARIKALEGDTENEEI